MKKAILTVFMITALLVSTLGMTPAMADTATLVNSVDGLLNAIGGLGDIELSGDIMGSTSSPISLVIDRPVTIDGKGHTLGFTTITVTSDNVTLKNLTVTAQSDTVDAVVTVSEADFFSMTDCTLDASTSSGSMSTVLFVSGSRNASVTESTLKGSDGYAIAAVAVGNRASDLTFTNSMTVANALGGITVSGGSTVVVAGAESVFDELVIDNDAIDSLRDTTVPVDKNIGPAGELVLIARYAQGSGNVVVRTIANIRKTVTLSDGNYVYVLAPYDVEAPFIGLAGIDDYVVVGDTADLSKAEIKDNRALVSDIKVYYTLKDSDGNPVTLTGSDKPNYINGYLFETSEKGYYHLSVYVEDGYGNRSVTRNIVIRVGGTDRTPPVISNIALGRLYSVGDQVVVPNVSVTDSSDVTVTVSLIKPDRSEAAVSFGQNIVFDTHGVYQIKVVAVDEDLNDTVRILEINVVGVPELTQPEDGGSSNPVVLYTVIGSVVISAIAGVVIFARKR